MLFAVPAVAERCDGRASGTGKSAGVRVIYFNRLSNGEIWLLTMYAKSARDTVPAGILKKIRETIDGEDG